MFLNLELLASASSSNFGLPQVRRGPGLGSALSASSDAVDRKAAITDTDHGSDPFVEAIDAKGATTVIPLRGNRIRRREYDRSLYGERNPVKRFFNCINRFPRIAIRHERRNTRFMAMINLVCLPADD